MEKNNDYLLLGSLYICIYYNIIISINYVHTIYTS